MAEAFKMSLEEVLGEVESLVESGKIGGRIDLIDNVCSSLFLFLAFPCNCPCVCEVLSGLGTDHAKPESTE